MRLRFPRTTQFTSEIINQILNLSLMSRIYVRYRLEEIHVSIKCVMVVASLSRQEAHEHGH